jgi:Na+-transporting NADH:ubiquinone oxidoreductase subunit NqrB
VGHGDGAVTAPAAPAARWVVPRLGDPRVTLSVALTTYTVLGQTVLYFNVDLVHLATTVVVACAVEMVLAFAFHRILIVPLSAYITGLSIGLLLESYDLRVFVLAAAWGISSKYLLRGSSGHFFNPSNFAIVAALVLGHGLATVAPGSQWGGKAWIAVVILILGTMLMYRVNRLDLALAWLGGFIVMGLARMLLGQGGLVFALGPMFGAEFALFSFSMLPDPKASPLTRRARIFWGLGIALVDGILRYLEVRYSMFYTLFVFCAVIPVIHSLLGSRAAEKDPWKTVERPLRS